MRCETVQVLSNEKIATDVYLLTLPFPHKARPGQFVMLKVPHSATLLARPVSICDVRDDTLILLYQVVGRGTGELSRLREGDPITVTGPVGNGFPLDEVRGKVALVGGGVGVAPLVYTGKVLKERGVEVDVHVGYRDETFLTGEFTLCTEHLCVSTESGAVGNKGFVTGTLHPSDYDFVFCCGPTPMMKAVTAQCSEAGVPLYVSLENKMGCGIGGCRTCTCTDQSGHNLRTCVEGPVFKGMEVDFDA